MSSLSDLFTVTGCCPDNVVSELAPLCVLLSLGSVGDAAVPLAVNDAVPLAVNDVVPVVVATVGRDVPKAAAAMYV